MDPLHPRRSFLTGSTRTSRSFYSLTGNFFSVIVSPGNLAGGPVDARELPDLPAEHHVQIDLPVVHLTRT